MKNRITIIPLLVSVLFLLGLASAEAQTPTSQSTQQLISQNNSWVVNGIIPMQLNSMLGNMIVSSAPSCNITYGPCPSGVPNYYSCTGVAASDNLGLIALFGAVANNVVLQVLGNCVLTQAITLPIANNVTIEGPGTITYSGPPTLGTILTIGQSIGGCSVSGWTIANLTINSTATMTSGDGLLVNDMCASNFSGIVIGGFNGGAADTHLRNGIQLNGGNSIHVNGYLFSASHDAVIVDGDLSVQFTDAFFNNGLVFGATSAGFDIAGNVGGFYLDQSSVLENGRNIVVSQDVTAVANSQIFFGAQAIIDATSGGAGIGIDFTDPGGVESLAAFASSWLASATNQCLKVESSVTVGWKIAWTGGQILNCNDGASAPAMVDNESTAASMGITFVGTKFSQCCNGGKYAINNVSGAEPITLQGALSYLNNPSLISGLVNGTYTDSANQVTLVPSGAMAIFQDNSTNNQASVAVTANAANGASMVFQGNGASTPYKFVRVYDGVFQILNNAYGATIMSLTDAGLLNAPAFSAGGTAGVSCTGSPTSSFVSVNGIVTHC